MAFREERKVSRNKMNENQASKAKKGKSRNERVKKTLSARPAAAAERSPLSAAARACLRASDPKIERWPIRDPASHWHIGLPVFVFLKCQGKTPTAKTAERGSRAPRGWRKGGRDTLHVMSCPGN
jgi:hypothetical protein